MFSIQNYIRDQINLINNGKKKKQIKNLYAAKKLSFIYNSIANKNPNPSYDIDYF